MKTEFIFINTCLLLTIVSASPFVPNEKLQKGNAFAYIDHDNNPVFSDTDIPYADVGDDDVMIYFRSRNTPETELTTTTIEKIKETDFDPQRRTMFVCHGWSNNKTSDINPTITNALLEKEDWNTFVVDWGSFASKQYPAALGAVPGVGDIVGKFITLLMETTGTTVDKINLAGHSLGAHVVGRAGMVLKGEAETIVGMDPALPLVDITNNDLHLDPTDAKYVQAIHTNGGVLGFLEPTAHTDFFPNGGKNQKGCGLDTTGECAHSRAHMYFSESVTNDQFKARLCASHSDWKKGRCKNNEASYFGGNTLRKTPGIFYLDTNKKKPFALG